MIRRACRPFWAIRAGACRTSVTLAPLGTRNRYLQRATFSPDDQRCLTALDATELYDCCQHAIFGPFLAGAAPALLQPHFSGGYAADRKVQFQVTLGELGLLIGVRESMGHVSWAAPPSPLAARLPRAVLRCAEALAAAAAAHLAVCVRDLAVAAEQSGAPRDRVLMRSRELLSDLSTRSVFRLWMYEHGARCRAHYDPGLCTALLAGSSAGLEINEVDILDCGPPGSRTRDVDASEPTAAAAAPVPGNWAGAATQQRAESMAHWVPIERILTPPLWPATRDAAAPTIDGQMAIAVMPGTLLQLIGAQHVRQVLHRVVSSSPPDSAAPQSATRRFNAVLELRPCAKKKWYRQQL